MDWLEDRGAFLAAHSRSVAAGREWLATEPCRALRERFDAVEPGDGDAAVEAAAAVLADGTAVSALIVPLVDALRADPLFEPPFRVHRDRLRIGAVLFDHPAVSVTASVLFADALAQAPPPRTVVMSGRRSVVRYHRAAGARLARWALGDGACRPAEPLDLDDGLIVRFDGRREASLIVDARRDVAMVTATVRYGAGRAMHEFAVPDGAPVRSATLDDAVSRTSVLLTLLRLSGRADAGEAFEAASRHAEHHLRWTAMREWLALDVNAALPRLRVMADDDPHFEVRAAAGATVMLAREAVSCRG